MNVVGPTLAVVFTWFLVALVLAGCGAVVGRGLRALAPAGGGELPIRTALWLGLAALYVYLQLWSLVLPIDWTSWPLPIAVASGGLVILWRRRRRPRPTVRAILVGAGLTVVVLWLANQALGPAIDYDLGLYHLNVIGYAERYPTIPGLGNLHSRLGAGDAQLLFVAFLAHGPWAGAAFHLVDGLLASLLLFELGARIVRPAPGPPSFTRRVAILLVPATVVLAAMAPEVRVASPNLDLAAFVLVAAGMLYLADCVENGLRLPEACVGVGSLAVAAATRPLYWLTTLLALVVVVVLLVRARAPRPARPVRYAVGLFALPVLLAVGWMVRQAILSGYPLYPLTFGALPVDWRIPHAVIVSQNQGDDAWARWPRMPPAFVLSSWQWLTSSWLPIEKLDLAVIAPLLLLGCLVPALGARGDPGRRRRLWPMLAIVVPSLVTLGVWFHVAPDPRFVWAPIWLVPIALVAWAVPPLSRPALGPLAVGLGGGVVLTVLLAHHFVWLLPALLGLWAYLFAMSLVLRRRRSGAFLAHAAVVSAVVVALGVLVDRNAFATLVHADQSGPFGTPLEPSPALTTVQTDSGLRLAQTAGSGDQCFGVLLCTPLLINAHLHMRGSGVRSGFSVGT